MLGLTCSSFSYATNNKNVIVFVWDGLRPDSISASATPNLYHLSQDGTYFNDNHSSFPTFTMMNASSFATGDYAGKTGFYGNTLWNNKVKNGVDSSDKKIDFRQPVFTEDYKILTDLNKEEPLVEVYTLFSEANKKGIVTSAVGKSGPAYFQDFKEQGVIFDEKHVYPLDFAKYLQSIKYPLPINTVYSYNGFMLLSDNGDPTVASDVVNLSDGVTSDPSNGVSSPYNNRNTYLMDSYLNQVMPKYKPSLSVIWLRNPDTTEHNYGVGAKAYYDALANQDMLLGKLLNKLREINQLKNTNIIVVSDHGHSNVSGPLSDFPLRSLEDGKVTNIDNSGYSVSGDFRPADLLTRAGFTAYDGSGCQYDPVLTGIKKDGKPVYPTLYDKDGSICGGNVKVADKNGYRYADIGTKYNTPSYIVPKQLPKDTIVVATNGGSTYFYVPSHNPKLVEKLVRFVQSRQEFGAVFVDSRYKGITGAVALNMVKLQNDQNRNPDVIVSSNYDEKERIQGFPGIEFNGDGSDRGMHGSFSPIDVHNTLLAFGPDFKRNFTDSLPSGNVDVAPTIAHILELKLPNTDGRVLYEALANNGRSADDYNLKISTYVSKPVNNIKMQLATSPDGKDIDPSKNNYSVQLQMKGLKQDGVVYNYFDWAKAVRY